MYKVIKAFADIQDDYHRYSVGDTFPRDNLKVSEKRFAELSSSANKQGEPLIAYVKDEADKISDVKTEKRVRKSKKD